jgi:hypothetical protein
MAMKTETVSKTRANVARHLLSPQPASVHVAEPVQRRNCLRSRRSAITAAT